MKKLMMKSICAIVIGSVMATGSFGQAVQVAYDFQRGKERDRPKEKEKDRPKDEKKNDKKDDKKKP